LDITREYIAQDHFSK